MEIARRLGKTPAQVLIRWSLQNGVITIPKSTKKARVKENMEVSARPRFRNARKYIRIHFIKVLDAFSLTRADMDELNRLHDGTKASWDPSYIP